MYHVMYLWYRQDYIFPVISINFIVLYASSVSGALYIFSEDTMTCVNLFTTFIYSMHAYIAALALWLHMNIIVHVGLFV